VEKLTVRPARYNGARNSKLKALVVLLSLFWLHPPAAHAQQDAFSTLGNRITISPAPADMGFIENSNGSLHLEIPLGTMVQRHGGSPLSVRLVYDSALVWQTTLNWTYNSSGYYQQTVWIPAPGPNLTTGGWQVTPLPYPSPQSGINYFTYIVGNYSCFISVNFNWTDYTGATHFFPITTQNGTNGGCSSITSGDALASDSSGYHMYVTNWGDAAVYAPDGSLVENFDTSPFPLPGNIEDTNGNYVGYTAGHGTDTVGRTLPVQVGNTTSLVVPSSQGTMTYPVTNASITLKTAFGQAGITEYSGTMQVIQSIGLPDGTSYQFKYDCDQATSAACGSPSGQTSYYGMLIGVTLPTTGQISYNYTNYSDPYGSKHRWLNSRTSAGGTWTYTPSVISTCSSSQVGCQQKVTVTNPSGNSTATTFTINNGAWPTLVQAFDSHGTLMSTVTDTYDFSQPCQLYSCIGAGNIRKLSERVSMPVPASPGTITKQTTYSYDPNNGNGIKMGNISAIQEWGYYSGSSPSFPAIPDRATYMQYTQNTPVSFLPATTYRVTGVTVCNNTGTDSACPGGGTRVSQKLITYDGYGVADACGRTPTLTATVPATGITNHDDTNFGTGTTFERGNPTTVRDWVSGSTYLCTENSYDTTGQVTQRVDTAGKVVNFSYTDNYFLDAGISVPPSAYTAPKPTNAYATSVTVPGTPTFTEKYGIYYGTGKQAEDVSLNGDTSFYHFDILDRPAGDVFPIGWKMYAYPGATEVDSYSAVGDVTPSTGCTSCVHQQTLFDNWGRQISQRLINNPAGVLRTDTAYDTSGRDSSVSHPYISPTTPVYETPAYDGLDQVISTTHPDGQVVQTIFGTGVSSAGGLAAQQSSTATYGFGYPVLTIDEAGDTKQQWLDGFGRIIEVDEPSGTPATPGTGSSTASGTEQVNSNGTPATGWVTVGGSDKKKLIRCKCSGDYYDYDYGTASITVNGVTVTYDYGDGSGTPPDTSASVASALVAAANANPNFPATATLSGSTINLTSKTTGTGADYGLTATAATQDAGEFPTGSWTMTTSASTLTGGQNGTGVYDTGSVWVTVNGFQSLVSYGQGSTPSTVAGAIASAFNSNNSSPVTASVNGAVLTITSKTAGPTTNYPLSSGSSTSQPTIFTHPSFSASVSGSTLTGGASSFTTTVYTSYQYDPLGNLTKVAQGAQTRTWVHDGLSRVTQEITPEAGTINQSFFASGTTPCSGEPASICQRTDARGVVTTYTYNDPLNRLTSKTYNPSTTPSVSYTYDQGGATAHALGMTTQMTDGTGSATYTYNAVGDLTQIQKVIGSATYTTSYTYNSGGQVTQTTYPSGRVVQQSYDVVGELCEVAPQTSACNTATAPFSTKYSYLPAQLSFQYGNGVTSNMTFSSDRAQLSSLTYSQGTQTLFNLNYYYKTDSTNCPRAVPGNNGLIQCINDSAQIGRSASYGYDTLRRLTSSLTTGSTAYPQWGLSWAYDRYGNRQSENLTAGNGPSNSLTIDPTTNRPVGYTFDVSGNMTVDPTSPPNNYTFDAENRLVSVTGNAVATYSYDGLNSRMKKAVQGGTTTAYVFSGSAVIAEYDNGALPASPSREYIYGGDKLLATISSGTTTFHHTDHTSVRVSTDGTTGSSTYGKVVGEQGHYPYGEAWYLSNTTTKKLFTTYERDPETGLDYAMARFYDSRVGRFCSVDPVEGSPIDPQTWNRYTYTRDEPIGMVDPSGKSFWSWLVNIIQFIFAIFTGGFFHGDFSVGTPPFQAGSGYWAPWSNGSADGLIIGEAGSLGSNFASTATPASRVYCDPGVMDAMKSAWGQFVKNPTTIDTKTKKPYDSEFGFPVYSKSGGGYSVGDIKEGSGGGMTVSGGPGQTVDSVFHTHPHGGLPSTPTTSSSRDPNQSDTGSAGQSNKDIYVITDKGLSRAPAGGPANADFKKNSPWIVQGKNIDDWLGKLKKMCSPQ
jgi:RHS repeat-associated protein